MSQTNPCIPFPALKKHTASLERALVHAALSQRIADQKIQQLGFGFSPHAIDSQEFEGLSKHDTDLTVKNARFNTLKLLELSTELQEPLLLEEAQLISYTYHKLQREGMALVLEDLYDEARDKNPAVIRQARNDIDAIDQATHRFVEQNFSRQIAGFNFDPEVVQWAMTQLGINYVSDRMAEENAILELITEVMVLEQEYIATLEGKIECFNKEKAEITREKHKEVYTNDVRTTIHEQVEINMTLVEPVLPDYSLDKLKATCFAFEQSYMEVRRDIIKGNLAEMRLNFTGLPRDLIPTPEERYQAIRDEGCARFAERSGLGNDPVKARQAWGALYFARVSHIGIYDY